MKSAGFEKAFIYLFFFYPFMISAENAEKCRFFYATFVFLWSTEEEAHHKSMHIKMLEWDKSANF